ncbi:hypothetical protein RND81_04G188100 [Saponaria officinalis]|uniref:holo-[acyl-carrier-protein] synthase n=1 Tax=Saponaria officinalis TaxID=3572 RepID=A0AAW1LNK0_SAPOF
MKMERGVQRWIVDISLWKPSPTEFSLAISLLPSHEHSSITRYVKIEDKKRAFVSRLLQYALVHEMFGIPFDEINIRRTVEGKPYVVFDKVGLEFPNYNFNVSHHGDFVAIASEPFCLVGLDIVSHGLPVEQTAPEFVNSFSSYFSSMEWIEIMSAGSSNDMLKEFYRYWTLKEAFVKAIGTGLRYSLAALEFRHINWTNISVNVHGKEARGWKFWHFELKESLYVSIARGSPFMATESYKEVVGQIECDEDAYDLWFNLPNPSFLWRSVEELIPN